MSISRLPGSAPEYRQRPRLYGRLAVYVTVYSANDIQGDGNELNIT